jgi:hypothetical protein
MPRKFVPRSINGRYVTKLLRSSVRKSISAFLLEYRTAHPATPKVGDVDEAAAQLFLTNIECYEKLAEINGGRYVLPEYCEPLETGVHYLGKIVVGGKGKCILERRTPYILKDPIVFANGLPEDMELRDGSIASFSIGTIDGKYAFADSIEVYWSPESG